MNSVPQKTVQKAVIPAAGMGTRFLPLTKSVPKEMAVILDRPALQWIIEEAVAAGAEEVIVVISPEKQALRNFFTKDAELKQFLQKKRKVELVEKLERLEVLCEKVHFVVQEEPLGLGHAVFMAEAAVGNSAFHVLLGDALVQSKTPCAAQLAHACTETGGSPVIGLRRVPWPRVSRYGVAAPAEETVNDRFRLKDLIEKPDREDAPSNLAVAGRYVLTPDIFDALRETGRGKNDEIQLTDAIRKLMQARPVYGLCYEGKRYDIGNPEGYLEACLGYAAADPHYRAILDSVNSERQSSD